MFREVVEEVQNGKQAGNTEFRSKPKNSLQIQIPIPMVKLNEPQTVSHAQFQDCGFKGAA